MTDVANIVKEAGAGVNDLLKTPAGPASADADVYRKTQDARLAEFDALISTLRGRSKRPR
jgi:hypothetical protein